VKTEERLLLKETLRSGVANYRIFLITLHDIISCGHSLIIVTKMCLLTKADFVFKSLNLWPQTLMSCNGLALLCWVKPLASPNGVAGTLPKIMGKGLTILKYKKFTCGKTAGYFCGSK